MRFLMVLSMFLLFSCSINFPDEPIETIPIPDDTTKPYPPPDLEPVPPSFPDEPIPPPNQEPIPAPSIEDVIIEEINAERMRAGVAPVRMETRLNCAASRHCLDIGPKRICGHTGSDGSSPWDRAATCGTSANGEIVACGQKSAREAVKAWYKSPGHNKIMLDPSYTKVGVAMHLNYWTAIFAY